MQNSKRFFLAALVVGAFLTFTSAAEAGHRRSSCGTTTVVSCSPAPVCHAPVVRTCVSRSGLLRPGCPHLRPSTNPPAPHRFRRAAAVADRASSPSARRAGPFVPVAAAAVADFP